jgi:IMP and pyridine-specific 5'-nucleotidase
VAQENAGLNIKWRSTIYIPNWLTLEPLSLYFSRDFESSAYDKNKTDINLEWIKGLLAVPFVLHSQPTGVFETRSHTIQQMADEAHRRYAEIMKDVEVMIDDHSKLIYSTLAVALGLFSTERLIQFLVAHQQSNTDSQSKLKLLVPSIGTFFTRLPLADAFKYQDLKRFISSRRFVAPSFNDIRLVLNTAQLMGLISGEDGIGGGLDLATFDGDVTL